MGRDEVKRDIDSFLNRPIKDFFLLFAASHWIEEYVAYFDGLALRGIVHVLGSVGDGQGVLFGESSCPGKKTDAIIMHIFIHVFSPSGCSISGLEFHHAVQSTILLQA